jgi:hypothetical protein
VDLDLDEEGGVGLEREKQVLFLGREKRVGSDREKQVPVLTREKQVDSDKEERVVHDSYELNSTKFCLEKRLNLVQGN